MNRMTKEVLEFKCKRIRCETGLNIGVQYFNDTQRIVLNGVHEKGCSGCKDISYCGTKKEIGKALDAVYDVILAMKYAGDEYRLSKGDE